MDFSKSSNRNKRLVRGHYPEKIYSRIWLFALRIACVAILAVGISAGSLVLGGFMGIIDDAPEISINSFTMDKLSSYVYDRNGKEIMKLKTETNRTYVSSDEISPNLINAVVAIEDARFYDHNGIDIQAIMRAGVSQLKGSSEGGSTITQQLIKNMILTSEQTFARKFQEWYLALNLEYDLRKQYGKARTKELILETYLNYVNFSNSTYGPEAAADRYFRKEAKDLSISESAVLAGIINAPSRYDPIAHPKESRKRQLLVLKRMKAQGMITAEEYKEAKADPVYKRIKKNDKRYKENTQEYIYSWYLDAALDQVIADLQKEGYSASEASNMVYYGGLKIYLNQDDDIQAVLDEAYTVDSNFYSRNFYQLTYYLTIFDEKHPDDPTLNRNKYFTGLYYDEDGMQAAIDDYKAKMLPDDAEVGIDYVESKTVYIEPQSAATIMDQHTGKVLAIIGGRGEKTQNRALNRASSSPRQPGSTFKVIAAFAYAIDSGNCTPASVYDDAPFNYQGWEPHNWWGDYHKGLCTLREACANSQNIVAAKCMIDNGVEASFQKVLDFGFTTLRAEPDENGNSDVVPSLCLGSGSVTNLELCAAYAAIANKGVYIEPQFYSRVEDSQGNIVIDKEKDHEEHRVIKETTAYLLTSMMEDCVSGAHGGTGNYADFNPNMGIAGKTGTTSDNNDLLFAGFTPYYTMAIWYGYDYNAYDNFDKSKAELDWANHIRLYSKVMAPLHEGLEAKQFEIPEGITTASVCSESGKLATSLCSSDPRGNCVYTEYFDVDNVPTEACDVHVSGEVCAKSHMAPGPYCPKTTKGVYIKRTEKQLEEISGDHGKIEDWKYELPEGYDTEQKCDYHTEEWKKKQEEKKKRKEEKEKEEEEKKKQEEDSKPDDSSDPEPDPDPADPGDDSSEPAGDE